MTGQRRLKTTVALIDTAGNDVLRRQPSNATADGALSRLTTSGDTANCGRAERGLVVGKTRADDTRAALLLIAFQLLASSLNALRISASAHACPLRLS